MIAGVILAAGTSTRLGSLKQLLPLEGQPILQHVIGAAAEAALDPIVIVLGHRASEVEAKLRLPQGVSVVNNPDYAQGQASSLRAGLASLPGDVAAAVILLGDQPGIRPAVVRAAVEKWESTGGPVVRTLYRGRSGHPVVLDRNVWSEVMAETGDRGARDLLAGHPEWVVALERDEDPPADVDTRADYEKLTDHG